MSTLPCNHEHVSCGSPVAFMLQQSSPWVICANNGTTKAVWQSHTHTHSELNSSAQTYTFTRSWSFWALLVWVYRVMWHRRQSATVSVDCLFVVCVCVYTVVLTPAYTLLCTLSACHISFAAHYHPLEFIHYPNNHLPPQTFLSAPASIRSSLHTVRSFT